MSQLEAIHCYLVEGNSITPLEALQKFGCFRLSGRILELRQLGINIKTEYERNGNKRFARYNLTK